MPPGLQYSLCLEKVESLMAHRELPPVRAAPAQQTPQLGELHE